MAIQQPPLAELPAGPLRDFVVALHALYRDSGMPGIRTISDSIRGRDEFPDTVSHETVGMMLRGSRLARWSKVECVVRLLAERSVQNPTDPTPTVREFHRLWLIAMDAATPDSSTQPPGSESLDTRATPLRSRPGAAREVIGATAASRPSRLITNLGQQNVDFVDRTNMREKLDNLFRSLPKLPVILYGPGGVGKSQLAIDYAYRHITDYDLIWFVAAEDPMRTREILVELGDRLRVPSGQHRQQTVRAVIRALEESDLRWLLIFDNAIPGRHMDTLIPGRVGDILVTTRAPEWTPGTGKPLAVDVFTRDESIRYLRNADREISAVDADRLATTLGDLPLAVAQVVAIKSVTRVSLSRYLALFSEHVQELLSTGHAPYYPMSLVASVKISIEHLDAMSAAAQVIELFAHLGPEPVQRALLRNGRRGAVTTTLSRCLNDPRQLRGCINDLGRLGLLKVESNGEQVTVHRLVRAALRENLSAMSVDRGRRNTHALLAAANPGQPDSPGNWAGHALITPHVLPSGLLEAEDVDTRRTVLDQVRYLYQIGDYEGSSTVGEAALQRWREPPKTGGLGEYHELTLLAMRHVANALSSLGRYERARALNDTALESFESNPRYGLDHPHTIETKTSQGVFLRIGGEYRAALAAEQENLHRHHRVHGQEHPRTLMVANNLAASYRALGQYEDAIVLNRDVAAQRARTLGRNDSMTSFSKVNLAWDLCCLGRFEAMLNELEEVRVLIEAELRPGHVIALLMGRAYSVALRKLGRYPSALDAAAETYERCNQYLGADHEYTLTSGLTYANSLGAVRLLPEAVGLATETRQSLSRNFGAENPLTLTAAVNHAVVLRRHEKWIEASEVGRDAWVRLEHRLGPEHPYTICAANNVASDLFLERRYESARKMSELAYRRAKRRYPEQHPDRLLLVANAGLDRIATGDGVGGDQLRQTALAGLARVLGADHPVVVRVREGERVDCEVEPPPL